MRAGTHERQIGYLIGIIKKENVPKHLCFISKNLRQQKSGFWSYRFVEAKQPLLRKVNVSSRGNGGT